MREVNDELRESYEGAAVRETEWEVKSPPPPPPPRPMRETEWEVKYTPPPPPPSRPVPSRARDGVGSEVYPPPLPVRETEWEVKYIPPPPVREMEWEVKYIPPPPSLVPSARLQTLYYNYLRLAPCDLVK